MVHRKLIATILAIIVLLPAIAGAAETFAMKPPKAKPESKELRQERRAEKAREKARKKAEKEAALEERRKAQGWTEDGLPPYVPPPSFARHKKPLPEILLRQKDTGFYATPFPIIGVDPDTGVNLGAAAQFYQNGKADSPYFRITPYLWTINALVLVTSKNVFQISSYYDHLYPMGTPWRIRAEMDVFNNPVKNYFGIGNQAQTLTFGGRTYGSFSDYSNALNVQQGGTTNARYDQFKYSHLLFRGTAEYNLLGGYIRPLFGIQVQRVWIGDYTGDTVDNATQNQTHLAADCASGRAIGCNGGWDNLIKLGISFDTRDFEPNPKQGIFWELVSELSPKFLGSSFNYGRLTSDIRAYGNILDWKSQLMVLAGRFYYGWQFGDVPFYSMNTIAFTDRDWTGLGGFRSIRGYRLDRFIGPVQMMANMELRYNFYNFTVFRQNLMLGIKPFIDIGRTFDDNSSITFRGWHPGGGVGLMLSWNISTVINFDYAWSTEGTAFYMEAGLQF